MCDEKRIPMQRLAVPDFEVVVATVVAGLEQEVGDIEEDLTSSRQYDHPLAASLIGISARVVGAFYDARETT